jgi:hypothetical protein
MRIFCNEGCRRSVLRRAQRTSDAIRMLGGVDTYRSHKMIAARVTTAR